MAAKSQQRMSDLYNNNLHGYVSKDFVLWACWLKQQVLCGDHSARCVRTCGRGGGTLQRGVQGKGIHGKPFSISLPETGPLLNRREVDS